MTNIMIDLTSPGKIKRYKINVCKFCDHDKYPAGKPIDISDKNAQQTPNGWKCGTCVNEDAKEMLKLNRRRVTEV
jgi:hypothetical protein